MVVSEIENYVQLKKIIVWNEGCAAQFRSHFVFKLLSTYHQDLSLEWHYNEAHHGTYGRYWRHCESTLLKNSVPKQIDVFLP